MVETNLIRMIPKSNILIIKNIDIDDTDHPQIDSHSRHFQEVYSTILEETLWGSSLRLQKETIIKRRVLRVIQQSTVSILTQHKYDTLRGSTTAAVDEGKEYLRGAKATELAGGVTPLFLLDPVPLPWNLFRVLLTKMELSRF